MQRVRVGVGVVALLALSLGSFLLWNDVSASPKQARGEPTGCAAVVNQRGALEQAKQAVVFEPQVQQLQQQGWRFHSYCCNPEFTDAHGQCSVFITRL